jgi:drug/metabolite transporter (DMT)-like permease
LSDWHHVFNERGALLAVFGALGGAVRSAALKTTWREGLRVVFIGSATSFGVGVLGPHLLSPWIGPLPDGVDAGALGTLCAAAFLIGLIAVTVIERIAAGKPVREEGNGQAD